MAVINRYRAVNEKTGEVLEGEAAMLAEEIGIRRKRLYDAACTAMLVKGGWSIEKIEASALHNKKEPKTLAERWDVATAPFKALSRELRGSRA